MKTAVLMLCLLLMAGARERQIESRVVNEETGEGIPYVNIKVKGKTMGTSASVNGDFSLVVGLDGPYEVIFSAVGYGSLTLKVSEIGDKVLMKPSVMILAEVQVDPELQTREITIGEVHKKLPSAYGNGKNPRLVARLFKAETTYTTTPYIKSIKLFTISKVKEAKFNIRLYKVTEDGEPGEYLYNENIIGQAEKGKHVTEIDLSDRLIAFPPEGVFVLSA